MGWGIVAILRQTPEENDEYKHQPLLVQYKQQANQLLSMHNYTPFVISGNVKK
jgi:hypothetical protein